MSNNFNHFFIKLTLSLGFVIALSACPEQESTATEKEPSQKLAASLNDKAADVNPQNINLKQQILDLISDKSCDSSSDCGAVAMGAKACGGPESYEVYSKKQLDEKQLAKLAEQYKQQKIAYNKANQMISNCMMELKPQVSCQQNQCTKSSHLQQLM